MTQTNTGNGTKRIVLMPKVTDALLLTNRVKRVAKVVGGMRVGKRRKTMTDCRNCEYHKEKWKETDENGKPLIYLEKVYCPLNECMFSDYPNMPYQFDNMTGSMNM